MLDFQIFASSKVWSEESVDRRLALVDYQNDNEHGEQGGETLFVKRNESERHEEVEAVEEEQVECQRIVVVFLKSVVVVRYEVFGVPLEDPTVETEN